MSPIQNQSVVKNIILTIAIPTYNGAKTLGGALGSIVSQLPPGVDILISDNASTDATIEVVHNFQAQYPQQIHYRCNKENLGADQNFDLAIRNANGKFVWLFSDDDFVESGALENVLKILNLHPELGALFVNYGVFSPDNKCLNPRASAIKEDRYFKDGESFLNEVTIGPIFCSSNIVRKSLWENADIAKFLGSSWVHYGVMTSLIRNEPTYCIATPYVRLNASAKWDTKGQLFKLTLTLAKIINGLPSYGYSHSTTRMLLGTIAKPLPITVINAKRDSIVITGALLHKVFLEFFRHYPLQSIYAFCLLLLPNWLYSVAFKMYRKIKRV